jgi:peptidoglycan/LPS O-acetylase OafA/YrhL
MQSWKLALTLLFVLAIGLLAWLVEYLTDRFRPDMGAVKRFIVLLLLAIAVGFAALQLASAHDHNHAERNDWLKNGGLWHGFISNGEMQ